VTRARWSIALALVALAVPLLCTVVVAGLAARPPAPNPPPVAAGAQSGCPLPREQMRYRHMAHLKAVRDRVVRDGDRSAQTQGISSCRNCHASREEFCDRCHDSGGIRIDCFECHAY
jgi:hypothetical protein